MGFYLISFFFFPRDLVGSCLFVCLLVTLSALLLTFKSFATLLLLIDIALGVTAALSASACLGLRWLPGVSLKLSFAFSKDKAGQKALCSVASRRRHSIPSLQMKFPCFIPLLRQRILSPLPNRGHCPLPRVDYLVQQCVYHFLPAFP